MNAPYYADDNVTLYHGDCLEIDAWLAADVLVTDPPYGMAYVSGYRDPGDRVAVAGDTSPVTRDEALLTWHEADGPHDASGFRPALVFGTWRVPKPAGTRQVITWHKMSIGPGMGDLAMPWGNATEEIYVIGSGYVGRRRQNLIATTDQRGGTVGVAALIGHPTPKPVGLLEQLIECCQPGVIADPFAGGGSTLLAARAHGRKAIGVELEERYCEIIAKRLAQDVLDFGDSA